MWKQRFDFDECSLPHSENLSFIRCVASGWNTSLFPIDAISVPELMNTSSFWKTVFAVQFVFVAYFVYWFAPFYCCINFKTCIQRDPCQFHRLWMSFNEFVWCTFCVYECVFVCECCLFFCSAVAFVIMAELRSDFAHPFKYVPAEHTHTHSHPVGIQWNQWKLKLMRMTRKTMPVKCIASHRMEWIGTERKGRTHTKPKRIPKFCQPTSQSASILLSVLSRFVIMRSICVLVPCAMQCRSISHSTLTVKGLIRQ